MRHIRTPGLELDVLLKMVTAETSRANVGQVPWRNSSMATDFYFAGSGGRPVKGKMIQKGEGIRRVGDFSNSNSNVGEVYGDTSILYENFPSNVFTSRNWQRSDGSVRIENNLLHITRNRTYDDYAELFLNQTFPITIESRKKLVSGGQNYLTPGTSFYYDNDDREDRVYLLYLAGNPPIGWAFGNFSNDWHRLRGSTVKAPGSENVWITYKAVLRQNGGDLDIKHDGNEDFTFIETVSWSIPNRLTRIRFGQPWDAVCQIDYVKIKK